MPRAPRPRSKVIADISIYPIGAGTSLGRFVREAYVALEGSRGVRLAPSAMSTVIEADSLDTLFAAVKRAHDALEGMGAQRIAIHLRIDHRLDKSETIEYKVRRITGEA
jgi:uncharacterized protein (TIGR00106 family)